jgi:dihydroflavonol-4-reductase
MAGAKKLVVGASGFLGSHVTRQLVDRGDDVRVLIRRTSSMQAIEDLDVEYHYGDIFYCVVDTRAWLRDPTPLFRTTVDGLRHVLDAAVDADLRRFVFTSTIGTIGIPAEPRPATEEDEFNWADKGGAYVVSRVEAENLVMRYARERGLPAVALCVSNTYGRATGGRHRTGSSSQWPPPENCPSTSRIGQAKWWGIEDAATALLLAAEKGRNGERYIVSERFMGVGELDETAADASGVKPRRFGIPLWAMYVMGYLGDVARIALRRDTVLSSQSVRLMHIWPTLDHGKAERELGWQPGPVHESVRRAAQFFRENGR